MASTNPLDNFDTRSYSSGFKDVKGIPTVCPTIGQATSNPVKMIDYIGCHKIFMIFLIAIVALLFYSGVKVKAAADNASGGSGGASSGSSAAKGSGKK